MIEYLKINTKKFDYYIKSNGTVSGMGLNPSLKDSKVFEIENSEIDKKMTFWNDDEEYDEENPGDGFVYFLLYSNQNVQKQEPYTFVDDGSSISTDSSTDSSTNSSTDSSTDSTTPSARRLLSTTSSTDLFFSNFEMDDDYNAITGYPWWWILLLVLLLLFLVLLIVFLIWCCCCCRAKENKSVNKSNLYENKKKPIMKKQSVPKNQSPPQTNANSSQISYMHSLYQDSFQPPVFKKDGDSTINHYMPSESDSKNAL